MPRLFKNLPLRQKLFVPMAASLALILTAATIYYPHRHRRALMAAHHDAAEKSVELFSIAIANALEQHDFVLLQRTLRGAQVDKNIILILLYDNTGELISIYDPNRLVPDKQHPQDFDLSVFSDRMILIDQDILGAEEQKLARLVLGYSLEELRAQVLEYRIVTFLIAFIAFSIGILLIDWISHGVTGTLSRLHEQMEEIIHRKNFGNKIEVTTADEIGRLAAVFNDMIEELQKRHNNILESQKKYQALYKKYKRLNQLKSVFVSDASHHLRTPLTILKGEVEVALRRPRSMESYQETLKIIKQETELLINIVENLLTLAKAETGELLLMQDEVNVSEICDLQVRNVRPLAEKKKLRLDVNIQPECYTRGDPNRLSEVIFNLLENAVKYTPEGRRIEFALCRNESRLAIRVRDQGIGISARDRGKIFERFYRGRNVPAGLKGTGLGLATCKSIVQAHGGEIRVESKEGEGSTFTVYLPMD